jgi:hypothetical protein
MWLVVLAVGLPSMFRNPTAGALVASWIVSEMLWLTGYGLPVDFYVFPDLFVLAVIFAKAEAYPCHPYRSAWDQLRCIITERSVPDRIVMLIFPVMWAIYVSKLPPFYVYWTLWPLAIVQYLAAGWEGLASLFRKSAAVTPDRSSDSSVLRKLVWGYG